jgi:hypothetical protein
MEGIGLGHLAEWMNLEVAHFFMSIALEVPRKTAGTMGSV